MTDYRAQTLHPGNLERLSFLPCFPSQNKINLQPEEETLLLTNVPVTLLSASQLARRQMDAYECQFNYIENKTIHVPSFMKFIYRNFIRDLSKKLKVNESILDLNLLRLNEITIHLDHHFNRAYHMHEWPMALEIFLQIDVDSCFMKTCAFRGSHPRSIDGIAPDSTKEEGVFCIDQPDTRYLMLPCTNPSCLCCYQQLDISCRLEPSVRLASEQAHRFVNNYQVYLNCHVTCKTTNFIYVLTCPCGQFDFIGSSHHSDETFKDVLFRKMDELIVLLPCVKISLDHRRESMRILHEFLLGDKIIRRTLAMYEREKTINEQQADKMRLYQHLTECSKPYS